MIQYLIKKIIYGILVLWGVLTLVFFLFTVLPGDPARMMLDQREDSQQLFVLKQKYGFDKSISKQYFLYLNDLSLFSIHSKNKDAFNYVLSGKYNYRTILETKNSVLVLKTPYLRESFVKRGKSGISIIADTFPNTFILTVAAIFIALLLGILLGVFSAIFKDSI